MLEELFLTDTTILIPEYIKGCFNTEQYEKKVEDTEDKISHSYFKTE